MKNVAVNATLLPNRIYFAAVQSGTAACTISAMASGTYETVLGFDSTATLQTMIFYDVAYGAFPANFPTNGGAVVYYNGTASVPAIMAQFGSSP